MKKERFGIWAALFMMGYSCAGQSDSLSSEKNWMVHGEVSFYFFRDDFFMSPVAFTEIGGLHLEARYNYEDSQTGSVLAGYHFSLGNKFKLDLIPLLGVSAGNTDALLPGAEFEIQYWNLGLYGETEYVLDFSDPDNNYFNYWGELYYSPADWVWFGICTQRIREKETDLDLQRGLFASFQWSYIILSGYYFNPFADEEFFMLNTGITF